MKIYVLVAAFESEDDIARASDRAAEDAFWLNTALVERGTEGEARVIVTEHNAPLIDEDLFAVLDDLESEETHKGE